MFEGVNKKLERAGYFLNNLKTLVEDAGGFAYIKRDKQQEMRASLDGFFLEIISAKDFFLQGVNDTYKLGLRKNNATDTGEIKCQLGLSGLRKPCSDTKSLNSVLKVVESIEKLLSEKGSWLWSLNNYRNSATHRELTPFSHEAEIDLGADDKQLFNMMREGKIKIKPILEGQDKEIAPSVKKINIPPEKIKAYLFKDPEDPSQGSADMEVLPYCEQSLTQMKEWLEGLYSRLN